MLARLVNELQKIKLRDLEFKSFQFMSIHYTFIKELDIKQFSCDRILSSTIADSQSEIIHDFLLKKFPRDGKNRVLNIELGSQIAYKDCLAYMIKLPH